MIVDFDSIIAWAGAKFTFPVKVSQMGQSLSFVSREDCTIYIQHLPFWQTSRNKQTILWQMWGNYRGSSSQMSLLTLKMSMVKRESIILLNGNISWFEFSTLELRDFGSLDVFISRPLLIWLMYSFHRQGISNLSAFE